MTAIAAYMGYPKTAGGLNYIMLNQSLFGTVVAAIYMAVWVLMEKGELTIHEHSAMGYVYGLSAAACDLFRIYMLVRAQRAFHGNHHNLAIVSTFTVAAAVCFDYFILEDMLEGNALIYTLCIPAIALLTSFLDRRHHK